MFVATKVQKEKERRSKASKKKRSRVGTNRKWLKTSFQALLTLRVSTIFKIKCDLRILLETGMILLIVCGVVLVVSVVGARMYILFKEKTINKHRYDN